MNSNDTNVASLARAQALLAEAEGKADPAARAGRDEARSLLMSVYRKTEHEAVAKAMLDLSKQFAWEGRILDAIELAMFGGALLRETLGECEASARSLLQHGIMVSRASNWGDAAKLFMQADEMGVRLANPTVRSMALSNIAGVFLELGRHSKAADFFKQSAAFAEAAIKSGQEGGSYYLAGAVGNLVHTYRFSAGYRSDPNAIDHSYRAIERLEKSRGPQTDHTLCQVHCTVIELLLQADRLDETAAHASKAEYYALREGSLTTLTRFQAIVGLIEVFRGHTDIGLARIERAVDECRRSVPTSLSFMLLTLLDARRRAGDLAGARKVQAEYMQHRMRWYRAAEADEISKLTGGGFSEDSSLDAHLSASDRELRAQLLSAARTENNLLWLAISAEAPSDLDGLHIFRVGGLAGLIAQQLGLAPDTCQQVRIAASLHDIGMIDVPASIQQSELSLHEMPAEDRQLILDHPVQGAGYVLGDHPQAHLNRLVIRHHHERFDGKGYPDRLAGDTIPLVARIVAVADAFDVMTHDRIRMPAIGIDDAVRELERGAGRRFDPAVVIAAIAVISRARAADESLDELTLQWAEQHEPARIVLTAMRRGQQQAA